MGRIRIGLGVLLMVAGVAGLVVGIVQAVAPDTDVLADAIAQADDIEGGVLEADVAAGDLTVFVVVPVQGLEDEEGGRVQNGVVKDVTCTVERPDGDPLTLRGSRQAHGVSTDEVSSVGWFSTGAGTVTVTCSTSDPKDADRALALAPGRPSVWAGGVVASVGGLAVGAVGWALAWWGWRAATASPGGRLGRRRRLRRGLVGVNPRLAAGGLLVASGLAILGFGLASRSEPPGPEDAVARGVTGAEPMTFTVEQRSELTIYVVGGDVEPVTCDVDRPPRPPATLGSDRLRNRGADGADGARAVGTFTVRPGEVTVTCSSDDPLFVVEGWTPTSATGVVVAIALGAVLVIVGGWTAWTGRRSEI